MSTVLTDIGSVLTSVLGWVTTSLTTLVSNDYFLVVISLCLVTVVIGIVLKFFKSFGLKRGSKRRGR